MTPDERRKAEARARRQAELEDGCDVTAGRIPFLANKFPVPKTDGMTPEEAEATLARWRAEVKAFVEETDRAWNAPAPAATRAVQPPAPPEVPAS